MNYGEDPTRGSRTEDFDMNSEIQVLEKPEWVSWDAIHQVIWDSHADNRRNGITMRNPTLSGEEIKIKLGETGKMLVAINDEKKLVGTAAVMPKDLGVWFGREVFAYCCFAAILPEYNGKGIYKEMCRRQEEMAWDMGLDKMVFDTHENNTRIINHALKAGYQFVDYRFCRDHYNVVMVKWLNGCPYPSYYLRLRFLLSKAKTKLLRFARRLRR